MTTPSPLSPVVGEAQASPKLTDVERAAMGTDLHVIACDTPLGECVECMTLLRTIRRIITAVTPKIAAEVTKPLKERLEAIAMAEEDRTPCPRCWDPVVHHISDGSCGHCNSAGGVCNRDRLKKAGLLIAAVSIPIPDGEREVQ